MTTDQAVRNKILAMDEEEPRQLILPLQAITYKYLQHERYFNLHNFDERYGHNSLFILD